MKHEWRYLHDLMAGGLLGLISFVQERLGDEGVAEAWRYGNERGWRGDVEKIAGTTGGRSSPLAARAGAHVPGTGRTRARSRSMRTRRSSPSG